MFGRVEEFQPEVESISAYLERVELFFDANSIDAERRVPVFLSVIGSKNYSLLRNLLAPTKPSGATYEVLTARLRDHFQPKKIVIAERFHFHRRNQAAGETIADYVAELRRLSTHCEFEGYLEDALRDRLVCGLRNEAIQHRLLSKSDLTFSKALEIAQNMEAAEKNAQQLHGAETPIQYVDRPSSGTQRQKVCCSRCGGDNHGAQECRFREASCHACGKKGHIAKVCRSKDSEQRRRPRKVVTRSQKWVQKEPNAQNMQVRSGVKPVFCKPRVVPFALKEALGKELDRLEEQGILKRVSHSDWASPIVPVPKADGRLRLCGDYKATINPCLEMDKYPLPRPDELFSALAGGQRFSKLDLTQAYQQMRVEEDSQQFLTINTQQGLYQYTRLPFGIASAPAIFQRTMDTILQGIPQTVCYIDDILVTGATDDAHLQNLEEVLR